MRETWAAVRWDVERIFEGDGVVVSFYRSISVGRKSGIEVVRDLTSMLWIRRHDEYKEGRLRPRDLHERFWQVRSGL
jgi:hypothetical protein